MLPQDDFFRDKFRTQSDPLTGVVTFTITLPNALWFWAEVSDALYAMCIADNWEKVGSVTVDEAVEASVLAWGSFQKMVGVILSVAWNTIPDNYLLCDGSSYLRVDYPELYAILPSAFIDTADEFHVPNLIGNVVVGAGSILQVGDAGGETEHTLTTSEMPSHSHTDTGHNHTIGDTVGDLVVGPGEIPVLTPIPIIPAYTGTSSANLQNTGGDSPHNNMQPYLKLQYVICAR